MRKSRIDLFSGLSGILKAQILNDAKQGRAYPVTIVSDRYAGTYSGAQWLAVYADSGQIPEEIGGGDGDEMGFWEGKEHEDWLIGKGKTPNEAHDDLIKKIIEFAK